MKKIILLCLITFSAAFAFAEAERAIVDDVSKIDLIDEKFIPEADVTLVYKAFPASDIQAQESKSSKKDSKKESAEPKEAEGFNATMRIYYPNSKKPESPLPVALFFGGGGWRHAHETQFCLISRVLSDLGMVAVFADYRTKKLTGVDDPTKCVEDAKSAVRYLREHCDELGVNPNMIAVGGGSAGGHLAAATAYLDSYNSPDENLEISCKPNLLLLYNPVIDNSEDGYGYDRVKHIFPDISPFHNLKDKETPSIVFVGTLDNSCKYTMCQKYKDFLTDKGVDCELYIYEGQKHSFFNYFKGREFYIDTLKKLVAFLQKHKYITQT